MVRNRPDFWLFSLQGRQVYPTAVKADEVGLKVENILARLKESPQKEISIRRGRMRATTVEVGTERLLLVWSHDAPKRRPIEELRHANGELEAIIESSHDGIVVADGTGKLIRLSNSYSRITGIPKEELLGKNVYDMVREGTVTPSGTVMVLEGREIGTLTQTYSSGRTSVITSTPVRDERGRIIRVVTNVRDMTEIQKLRDELNESRAQADRCSSLVKTLTAQQIGDEGLLFRSPQMKLLRERALRFAQVDAPLLILGESGVGKEVVANFVHKYSARRDAPFLKINCGAIPSQLLESELFGYERGAFTGARKEGHVGLLEQAAGGSILLDEIGEMPLPLQIKLLRFVQHREFFRLGGNTVRTVDVRIIAATNQDLEKMIEAKLFRIDLFYRLNVLCLQVPPLRERPQDIILLAHHFLQKYNRKHGTNKKGSSAFYRQLEQMKWLGNVRELENVMERLVITGSGDTLFPEMLRFSSEQERDTFPPIRYHEARDLFEKNFWTDALRTYGSCREAARHLGVDHSTVVKKLARYGISRQKR